MIKRFDSFIFVLVLVLQVSGTDISSNGSDTLEYIQEALLSLNKIVEESLILAQKTIEALADNADNIRSIILEETEKTLLELKDSINEELETLKNTTTNNVEVVAVECIESQTQQLENTVSQALNFTVDCATDNIKALLYSLDAVIEDLEKYNTQLGEFEKQITSCRSAENESSCLLDLLGQIIEAASKIPEDIKQDLDDSIEKIERIYKEINRCKNGGYDIMDEEGNKIYNAVVNCIENKLRP